MSLNVSKINYRREEAGRASVDSTLVHMERHGNLFLSISGLDVRDGRKCRCCEPIVLANKYGGFNVIILMVTFSILIVFGLWLPGRSAAASIVFAVLFGIGSGAVVGLGPVLIISISPANEVGYRTGPIFAIAGVSYLTSPPIGSAYYDCDEERRLRLRLRIQRRKLPHLTRLHHLAAGKTRRLEYIPPRVNYATYLLAIV